MINFLSVRIAAQTPLSRILLNGLRVRCMPQHLGCQFHCGLSKNKIKINNRSLDVLNKIPFTLIVDNHNPFL